MNFRKLTVISRALFILLVLSIYLPLNAFGFSGSEADYRALAERGELPKGMAPDGKLPAGISSDSAGAVELPPDFELPSPNMKEKSSDFPAPPPATSEKDLGPSAAESFFNSKDEGLSSSELIRKKMSEGDKQLRQFGYEFFQRGTAFTPDLEGLVGPDYIVGPGDTLRIDIWGNVEGNYRVTVNRNGEITLPKVGVINVWGQTFAEAKQTIERQIRKYFTNFELNVTMGQLRSIQVYVVGEVDAPGTYRVSSVSTVLTALSAAGGPARTGSLRNVQLRRNGELVSKIDFYDFFLRGDRSKDVRLQSGDTLFIPVAGPLVGVAGNVRRPAIYELQGGETLADALDLAGGLAPTAYTQKVQVERIETFDKKVVLDLNLQSAEGETSTLDLPLQDRDMIKVAPIALSGGYVMLEGYTVRPGSYELSEGMRLSDLVLNYDNLLPEFYPGAAQIVRLNPPEYRPEMMTVNLELALEGDPEHNLLLQEYDTIRLFSRKEMEEVPQAKISGAILKPGTYRIYDRMTVKDLVASAGNLKRSAFVEEAELTRFIPQGKSTKTVRRIIDLEKALAGDPQENILLLPEDHLFIRSIPDYSERSIVTVKGEVMFPGQYVIEKGEKLSSVLERAGGYTSEAYLRGAFFARESAKEMQRQRMQKLIMEEEQEIMRVSNQMAQGAMDEADVAAAQAMLETRAAMVAKLKAAPVTGRMVVHLETLDRLRGTPYDVDLMDGDEITIPESSQMVTVLGEVYNTTALTYKPGKSVSYYLNQVGGMTEDANKGEVFVVRADGTVISKQQGGLGIRWDGENHRWSFGGFNSLVLHPGDAILVPEEVKTTDWMKETKDITTILYQMALGAAAVAAF